MIYGGKEKKVPRKRSGILTKIIIVVLIIYAVTSLIHLQSKIEAASSAQAELQQQVSAKTASNEDLRLAIENNTSDDVIEDVARDKLGFVMQNEDVYYAD